MAQDAVDRAPADKPISVLLRAEFSETFDPVAVLIPWPVLEFVTLSRSRGRGLGM